MAKRHAVNPIAMQRKINNGVAINNRRAVAIKTAEMRMRMPNGRFK